tara:strand:- start:15269 stop:16918 length:1650 start_codon:yes stop_codon:yes gene_type:complete
MAEATTEDIKELGHKIVGIINIFKSSSEKTHDALVRRRDISNKSIQNLEEENNKLRTTTRGQQRQRFTKEEKETLQRNTEALNVMNEKLNERIVEYKAKFGEKEFKHQERKKTDPVYAAESEGKTKGDQSRMEKIKSGFYKRSLGYLQSISKGIKNIALAPLKFLGDVAGKGLKAILVGLGLISFIKFLEGLEKATKWFGDNPSFGEMLAAGLSNLIGFFTGASDVERKQMALNITEFFTSVGDYFKEQAISLKKIKDAKGFWATAKAIYDEYPMLTKIVAGILLLVPAIKLFFAGISKLFSMMSKSKIPTPPLTKGKNNPLNNKPSPSSSQKTKNNLSKTAQNSKSKLQGPGKYAKLMDVFKKGARLGLAFLKNGSPLLIPLGLGAILASDDGKSTIEANRKNNIVKGGLTKNVDAKAEEVFVDNLNQTSVTDLFRGVGKKEKDITNALQNYFTKNLKKAQNDLKLEKMQLVPDQSTALSETNVQLKGHIDAVQDLTKVLKEKLSLTPHPNEVKVNNTSINNNQTSNKLDMKYFTSSKGKGPYANMLS